MNKASQNELLKELRSSGASPAETDELVALASRLSRLKDNPNQTQMQRPTSAIQRLLRQRWFRPALATALVFLVVSGVVLDSQASLPGSLLYPVKRASENTAVAVDPAARATLMMRRAEEVKQLVATHASTQTIAASLAAYRSEATAYKTKNYAAFRYCRANLQQAAAQAQPAEQRLIASTIASIPDVD